MNVYHGDWAEDGLEGMLQDFGSYSHPLTLDPGVEVLYAWYEYADSGDAFVLFRKDGKLYEVHGSHCSCYGLEGQWDPEETTAAALLARPHITGWDAEESDQTKAIKALVAGL